MSVVAREDPFSDTPSSMDRASVSSRTSGVVCDSWWRTLRKRDICEMHHQSMRSLFVTGRQHTKNAAPRQGVQTIHILYSMGKINHPMCKLGTHRERKRYSSENGITQLDRRQMSESAKIDTLGVGSSGQECIWHVIEPATIEDCACHRLELRYQGR
jgi:hypothetical protein